MGWKLDPELEAKILALAGLQGAAPPLPEGMREADFQAEVVKFARRGGWLVYHTHTSKRSAAGFPDLVCLHPTRGLLVAELKVPPNTTTPEQQLWLAAFRAAGIPAYVWSPENWPEIQQVLQGDDDGRSTRRP